MRFAATIATASPSRRMENGSDREQLKAHLCDGHHIALAANIHIVTEHEPCRAAPRLGARHHPQRTLQWPPSKTK
jgi:hypothetical protein